MEDNRLELIFYQLMHFWNWDAQSFDTCKLLTEPFVETPQGETFYFTYYFSFNKLYLTLQRINNNPVLIVTIDELTSSMKRFISIIYH